MKPQQGSYPEFYHTYISKVAEDDVISALENNFSAVKEYLSGIPEEKENHAYAEGKWTIKQLINHLLDAERIFAYRALCFARKEAQVLPSFDEEEYAKEAAVDHRNLSGLVKEFEHIRQANIFLFKSFSNEVLQRIGRTQAGQITVLAIGFIICGHAVHHMEVISGRYLKK